MASRRRQLLAAVGTAVSGALAGCPDTSGGDSASASGQTDGGTATREPESESESESESPVTVTGTFPQHQYDAANTGATPANGPTGAVSPLFEVGSDRRGRGSPTVGDGTLFLTERADGDRTTVSAVDAADGTVQWERTYGSARLAGPTALTDERVLARVGPSVVALDRATGDHDWAFGGTLAAGLAVADGTVYAVGEGRGTTTLHAVSVADGTRRWHADFDAAAGPTTPGVRDGTVYVGGDALRALDTEDGTERWRTEDVATTAPAVSDDRVVVGSGSAVRVYGQENGTLLWSDDVGDLAAEAVGHSPAVADGTVYLAHQGFLVGYDIGSGDRRYAVEVGIDSPPVVAGDGCYLFGPGRVVRCSVTDGTPQWSYGTRQRTESGERAPAIVDGVAYVPAERLYAIAD
jgi:outer membrane protein assembly factor BamB